MRKSQPCKEMIRWVNCSFILEMAWALRIQKHSEKNESYRGRTSAVGHMGRRVTEGERERDSCELEG